MKVAWILLVAIIALVLVAKFLAQPIAHKNITVTALPRYIASLMVQATDGSLLFISIPKSSKFLQFVKYIDPSQERLAFGFPDAPWSRDYFDELTRRLKVKGIDYEIEETGRQDTRAFLNINDIKTIEDAQAIVSEALEAIGESRNSRFSVRIEGGVSKEIYQKNKDKYEMYFRAS